METCLLSLFQMRACVLGPLIFILYTDSCRSCEEGIYLGKLSLTLRYIHFLKVQIRTIPYLPLLTCVTKTSLTLSKTKELVIDFGKDCLKHRLSSIHGKAVEIVDTHKYLGTVFDSQFKFDENTECKVVTECMVRVDCFNWIALWDG